MLFFRVNEGAPVVSNGVWAARRLAFALAAAASLTVFCGVAGAETIGGALIKAYFSNPDINQQRAAVRASDENIPKATAGYRPTVTAEADAAVQQLDSNIPGVGPSSTFSKPRGYGLTVNQTLWNGQRTFNSVRQAETARRT